MSTSASPKNDSPNRLPLQSLPGHLVELNTTKGHAGVEIIQPDNQRVLFGGRQALDNFVKEHNISPADVELIQKLDAQVDYLRSTPLYPELQASSATEQPPFSVVSFASARDERLAILFKADDQNPAKVVVAGSKEAESHFREAVDVANSLVDSGTTPNPKMIEEHPAVHALSSQKMLIGINPAIRKAAQNGQVLQPKPLPEPNTKSYRYSKESLPDDLVATVRAKLGDRAQVVPPLADGKYKGKVVYENKEFLVQGVYKRADTGYVIHNAIAHRKSDLEFLSDNHQWRSEHGRFGGQEIRVIYDGQDKAAKVYPYSLQKELQEREAKKVGIDVSGRSPKEREAILQKAGIQTPGVTAAPKIPEQQPSMER